MSKVGSRIKYSAAGAVVTIRPEQQGNLLRLRVDRVYAYSPAIAPAERTPLPTLAPRWVDVADPAGWGSSWQILFDLLFEVRSREPRTFVVRIEKIAELPARYRGAVEALCRSVAEELGVSLGGESKGG